MLDSETGELSAVNGRWAAVFDASADRLEGTALTAAFADAGADPSGRRDLGSLLEALAEGDRREGTVDLTIAGSDGEDRVVRTSLWRLSDAQDEPRIAATVSTPSEASTGARAADAERYRPLVEDFPNGLATRFDEDLRYTLVGGTMFDELPLDPSDLEGKTLHEAFPPENARQLEPLYRAALAGESNETELTFEGYTFRIFVRPALNDDDEIVGGLTLSQNVTERRERERELETARKRYRTLIEAAPDPIFVADASTGRLIETNRAAEEMVGLGREALAGRHQTELHPPEDEERYRRLFESAVEDEGVVERFEDGSPVEVVTDDGERIPVAISTGTVTLDGREVVYGIFRDNRAQVEHERTLTELHETARTLLRARTKAQVAQDTVEAVSELFDLAAVTVYRFDETDGVLRPQAWTTDGAAVVDPNAVVEPGERLAWEVFVDGERTVDNDVGDDATVYGPGAEVRSAAIESLGDYGVLVVADTDEGAFDERTVQLVQILAETAESAIDHIDKTEQIRHQETELDQRLEHLERLEDVNAQIRKISSTLLQAEHHRDIEEQVCANLVESGPFAFAWIGEPDAIDGTLSPCAWAGEAEPYLDKIAKTIEDVDETDDVEPAIETALTREPTIVRNTARSVTAAEWRNHLVTNGLQSAMSVPLLYNDILYGVLTVYATEPATFDGLVQSVVSELGDAVGYAINSVYRKHALSADQVTEFEFSITDERCFFLQFARETCCPIEFKGMVPEEDGSSVVFVEISECDAEEVLTYVDRSTAVAEARLLEERDSGLRFKFRVSDSFVGTSLADYGLSLRSIAAEAGDCRVTIASPPTIDSRRVEEVVQTILPDSRLAAKRDRVQPDVNPRGFENQYLDDLTDRQCEVVKTAYRHGYFDSPKGASGTELAEEMGISPSAFHDNLRAAERKLLSALITADE